MAKKKTATIKIQWVRSQISCPGKQRLVLRGLGFRKLQQVVERPDTPAIRGMVAKIPHLVEIVDGAKGSKA
ncbi:MAG: 50S ribosomal protein L30 [Acidobacteria bacterium]|nr:50S ribosomal protein L30 [Acidobacteriota bacterium]